MKFCTECGAALENGKCPQCGAFYAADTSPEPAAAEATPNSFTPYDPVVVQTNSINSKIKICKHCGSQIAKDAKKCPKCGGKNSKPIYKKAWFWIVIALIILLPFGNNSDENSTSTATKPQDEASFKSECISYSYDTLARNPLNYKNEKVVFRGEVIQSVEKGNQYVLRVNVTESDYIWEDTIYVEYTKQSDTEPRILEEDIITLYGLFTGTVTYKSILGAQVTIPAVAASFIEIE